MALDGTLALFLGAVALGAVHGIEPGHGWPVAATYALDRPRTWFHGFAASFVLGVGHLISSIAMVGAFFYAKACFDLTEVNEPMTVLGGIQIGGPVSLVAGLLLVALGVREYRRGRSNGRGYSHGEHGDGHSQEEPGHDQDFGDSQDHHGDGDGSLPTHLASALPFVGGHPHADASDAWDERATAGLLAIAWFAVVLGFAHEEEFEIFALCAGSRYCQELMGTYALAVIARLVGLTMLLISGYAHFEEEVERYAPYLPLFSAVVLLGMGLGFVTGLL